MELFVQHLRLLFAGVAASATFENIYVRMPNPDVQYRGWLFYRSCADPAMFKCFNLSLTYTGVFHTTNALTFTAFLGTNLVYGPCVVEGGVWTHDFGHCVAAAGERVLVNVWDDADHNGEWDTGETSNRYTVAMTSHEDVSMSPDVQ